MNHLAAKRQNRREMFRSTLRYLALGGISLTSAGLIARGVGASAEGCRRRLSCGGCAAIVHCNLPQALAMKRRSEKGEGEAPAEPKPQKVTAQRELRPPGPRFSRTDPKRRNET